jgi:hypothetical protein
LGAVGGEGKGAGGGGAEIEDDLLDSESECESSDELYSDVLT